EYSVEKMVKYRLVPVSFLQAEGDDCQWYVWVTRDIYASAGIKFKEIETTKRLRPELTAPYENQLAALNKDLAKYQAVSSRALEIWREYTTIFGKVHNPLLVEELTKLAEFVGPPVSVGTVAGAAWASQIALQAQMKMSALIKDINKVKAELAG